MKTKSSRCQHAILSLALCLAPSILSAQTYSLGPVSASLLQSQSYTIEIDGGETSYTSLQEIPVSPALGGQTTWNLFCLELGQEAPGGPGTPNTSEPYTILPIAQANMVPTAGQQGWVETDAGIPITGIGSATAAKLELLYGFVFGSSYNNATSPFNINLQALGVGTNSNAAYGSAVFQIAAWQLAETGGYGAIASSGSFYMTNPENGGSSDPGLLTDADALLTAVSQSNAPSMNLDVLHSDTYQDYILPDPSGQLIAVPETGASAAIMGAASLLLVLGARRFLRVA